MFPIDGLDVVIVELVHEAAVAGLAIFFVRPRCVFVRCASGHRGAMEGVDRRHQPRSGALPNVAWLSAFFVAVEGRLAAEHEAAKQHHGGQQLHQPDGAVYQNGQ